MIRIFLFMLALCVSTTSIGGEVAISALPAATSASGTDVTVVVQGGVTKKVALSAVTAGKATDTVAKTGNTTTFATCTGTLTSGHAWMSDANGNCVDGGFDLAADHAKLGGLPTTPGNYTLQVDSIAQAVEPALNIKSGNATTCANSNNAGAGSSDVTCDTRIQVNPQTGNYTVQTTDRGKLIRMTGTTAQTLTFPAVATLTTGFYVYVENANTGSTASAVTLTYAPNGSEKIDTAANGYDYPGARRLFIVNTTAGNEIISTLLHGGYVQVVNADSPFTLNIPTGLQWAKGWACGSGAGGGAGGTVVGGTGGGGASCNSMEFRNGDLGTSQTITIGAGGAAGSNGNNTTFGAFISGYKGGAGQAGIVTDAGGGGASCFLAANTTTGGNPLGSTGCGGASGTASTAGTGNVFGGASGGGSTTGTATAGGVSYLGGRGGGSGGAIATQTTGGAGGGDNTAAATSGGGGSGGAGSASSAAASNGAVVSTSSTSIQCGLGGGGGGGNSSTGNGGQGAVGGLCSGGGGGGAAGTGTPGAGGAGGGGVAWFVYRYHDESMFEAANDDVYRVRAAR